MSKIKGLLSFLVLFSVLGLPFSPTLAQASAAGQNVKISDGTVFFITADGMRRPYTSLADFLSYRTNSLTTVQNASQEDIALPIGHIMPPQEGRIICSTSIADKGTCYLISQGQKAGFTSAAIFKALGFKFSQATKGDVSFLQNGPLISSATEAHLPGTLVNSNGTISLVTNSGLVGIPSAVVLKSWGYTLSDVVSANSSDSAMPQTVVIGTRQAGDLNIDDSTALKICPELTNQNGTYGSNNVGVTPPTPNNCPPIKICLNTGNGVSTVPDADQSTTGTSITMPGDPTPMCCPPGPPTPAPGASLSVPPTQAQNSSPSGTIMSNGQMFACPLYPNAS